MVQLLLNTYPGLVRSGRRLRCSQPGTRTLSVTATGLWQCESEHVSASNSRAHCISTLQVYWPLFKCMSEQEGNNGVGPPPYSRFHVSTKNTTPIWRSCECQCLSGHSFIRLRNNSVKMPSYNLNVTYVESLTWSAVGPVVLVQEYVTAPSMSHLEQEWNQNETATHREILYYRG